VSELKVQKVSAPILSGTAQPLDIETNGIRRLRVADDGNVYLGADLTTNLNDLITRSLSSNGYQKLPGGLIVQWGQQSGISSSAEATYSFPLTFPTVCLRGWCGHALSGDTVGAGAFEVLSASQFKLRSSVSSMTGSWLAIGY
jgi:hypothetical protein